MNSAVWNHPITAKQIQTLEGEWEIVHPIKYGEANIGHRKSTLITSNLPVACLSFSVIVHLAFKSLIPCAVDNGSRTNEPIKRPRSNRVGDMKLRI